IEISKKIIDFVSGATYGVDGKSQQIGSKVFLFVPAGVEITPEGPNFYALPGILRYDRELDGFKVMSGRWNAKYRLSKKPNSCVIN
ncbi:MAG: cell division protein SepF, partial [Syntrophomonadaceae bacterium]|nr:cell division protein SepF [Syntrophomonadaceae bacterium]